VFIGEDRRGRRFRTPGGGTGKTRTQVAVDVLGAGHPAFYVGREEFRMALDIGGAFLVEADGFLPPLKPRKLELTEWFR
jgi:hypothetical protein